MHNCCQDDDFTAAGGDGDEAEAAPLHPSVPLEAALEAAIDAWDVLAARSAACALLERSLDHAAQSPPQKAAASGVPHRLRARLWSLVLLGGDGGGGAAACRARVTEAVAEADARLRACEDPAALAPFPEERVVEQVRRHLRRGAP